MPRFSSILIAFIAFLSLQAPLAAAELETQPLVKAPPPPVLDWTGLYFGIHGGYGLGHDPLFSNNILSIQVPFSNIDSRGAVYGIHAGYNWQYKAFVGGFEADFSGTQIRGSTSNGGTVSSFDVLTENGSLQDRFDYMGSLRARGGFLASPNILLYITGGPAWEHTIRTTNIVETDVSPPFSFTSVSTVSGVSNRFGAAVGAGIEARFSAFSLPLLTRVEYLHYDFGNLASSLSNDTNCNAGACGTSTSFSTTGRLTTDVVRAGVSIQFK